MPEIKGKPYNLQIPALKTEIRPFTFLLPLRPTRPQETPIFMAFPSIFAVFKHVPAAPLSPDRLPIEQIRQQLRGVLHDCTGMDAQRVIFKIDLAGTPADLWLLRSDLHQCISRTHNQAEAARRINALLETFCGWIPAIQLSRI